VAQPRAKGGIAAEAGEGTIDPQGDLLEHIVHQLPIPDDVIGHDPEPAVVVPHDGDERLVVATHGRGEDVGLDLLGPLDAGRQGRPSLRTPDPLARQASRNGPEPGRWPVPDS